MEQINIDLQKGLIKPGHLLSDVKLIDSESRQSSEFQDKRYLPFYYHLGKYISPEKVIQIGPKLGLPAVCFLRSCKTVKLWTVLGESDRFVKSNIGMYAPIEFKKTADDFYDLALLTEPHDMADLEILWSRLASERLLIVDYIDQGNFSRFCKVKNIEPTIFKTRNGIGIVKKR